MTVLKQLSRLSSFTVMFHRTLPVLRRRVFLFFQQQVMAAAAAQAVDSRLAEKPGAGPAGAQRPQ